jgi:hypothetical protein
MKRAGFSSFFCQFSQEFLPISPFERKPLPILSLKKTIQDGIFQQILKIFMRVVIEYAWTCSQMYMLFYLHAKERKRKWEY